MGDPKFSAGNTQWGPTSESERKERERLQNLQITQSKHKKI